MANDSMNKMSVRSTAQMKTKTKNKRKDKIFTVNNIISFEIAMCVCVCNWNKFPKGHRTHFLSNSCFVFMPLFFLLLLLILCVCVFVLLLPCSERCFYFYFSSLHNQLCLVLPSSMLMLLFVFIFMLVVSPPRSRRVCFLFPRAILSLQRDFFLLLIHCKIHLHF